MSEINTNLRANPGQAQSQKQAQGQSQLPQARARVRDNQPPPTIADANRLPGLGSGLNTDATIAKIIAVERRRLRPIEHQKTQTLQELESFKIVNQSLNKINGTAQALAGSATWEGKIVESSDKDVVTATATSGAKPGKHTLVVDKLALNHQIASQGYKKQDTVVGKGKFNITVGKASPVTVVLDDSNDTLAGLKDAINFATNEVNATIIKTGSKTAPYQLVLTSQKTGSAGRITLDVKLQGGTTPNFKNSVEAPSPWKGVGAAGKPGAAPATGTGASTAIVQVIGDYTGKEDNNYTFTAVQSGTVGNDGQLQLRWRDQHGRSGVIDLDSFHYAPGKPIDFVDGLALIVSPGDVIVGDSFSFSARAKRSDLYWWVSPDNRKASYTQPTAWQRQGTAKYGAPVIEGDYTGSQEQTVTLTVKGSGQIGGSRGLSIEWKASGGDRGVLGVGQGYRPGSKLALTEGLTLSLKPGVLSQGQTASFRVTPREQSGRWWLSDKEREIPPRILDVTNWSLPAGAETGAVARMPQIPEALGPRVSSSKVKVTGTYDGDESKVYTFTAARDGAIGTTKDLKIHWEDDKGHSGDLSVGEGYVAGTPLAFDAGLSVAFGPGRVFKDDAFTVRTRTATVQPPQDAEIRFGATALGGGLKITSTTNEMDNVIEGVRLNLVTTSKKPVTITVTGDTKKAIDEVDQFVKQFNELAGIITELTKYDKDRNLAGPLLGNRDITDIRTRLSDLLINPVSGLPRSSNMLMSLGIKFNDKGYLDLDQATLQKRVNDDFAQVADLFRNKGKSSNNQVAFVGMTGETHVNTDGYAVNITQPATQGSYESPPLQAPIVIDDTNDRLTITVDGRQSGELVLPKRSYTLDQYARALQDQITNDKSIGQRGVRVVAERDRIKVLSGRFGERSSIAFAPSSGRLSPGVGLQGGVSQVGKDVAGTVDGLKAEGTGQLLKVPEKHGPASGLRLFVKLNESQLNAKGPEAKVVITKGVGSRVATYLDTLVNPLTGQMKQITENLRTRVRNLDQQLKSMEDRISAKRKRLKEKFARLESQMATLKSQQSFMAGQLANLGGGGGGIPGLPGLPHG